MEEGKKSAWQTWCIVLLFLLVATSIIMVFWTAGGLKKGEPIETYCQEATQTWWEENYSGTYDLQIISFSTLQAGENVSGEKESRCVATIYQNIKGDPYIDSMTVLVTITYSKTNIFNSNLVSESDIIDIEVKYLGY